MSAKKNILLGYSGHGYVVADAAIECGINLVYYADNVEKKINPYQLEYIGDEQSDSFTGWGREFGFILGIGDNHIRQSIASLISEKEEQLLTIKHPSSVVSKRAKIGEGTFIASNVSVNSLADIGNYVILNTNSIVEHGCKINEAVHIAPGAVLLGDVMVGDRTFIGANAVIKQGIKIGSDVTIGAGSTILNDVPDGKKVVGNPGREI